ncbi:hypothetical protein [Microbulbifer sp. GL-2]|uniref:hypothetical protein n=1 Tax=Microbulbifer sp. GL-2 TaxID=2591606 RepID=UPI0011629B5E|nr:hypothetical protein [Microbulbifer sp. GL-2]BBM03711.1 hypothetical protein GL2_37850 [Microbulbifer sp. GL-2]
MESYEKAINQQKRINILLSVGLISLGLYVAIANSVTEFEEISAERINIVEKSGLKRMVLANSDKAPGAEKFGKEVFRTSSPRPGMIFYNDEGTENGGFIFRGKKEDGTTNHGLHLSFDRYNQDQTLMVQHIEQPNYMVTGLTVMDRPDQDMDFELAREYIEAKKHGNTRKTKKIAKKYDKEKLGGTRRAFYGTLNGDSKLQLNDADGNNRIQMIVTKSGEAKLEFLSPKGEVIMSLPQK